MKSVGVLCKDEFFHDDTLKQLGAQFEVHDFRAWDGFDQQTLLKNAQSVEILLTGWGSPKLPLELAQDRGKLRYICHTRGSIRHVVPKELIVAGVTVTNWGENWIDVIAEGAMALLFCMLKQLPVLDAWTKGGPDRRIHQAYRCTLKGRDVGLYGFGPIGRHMARMLQVFGAKIAIYDPYAKNVPPHIRRCETLKELFSTCQIISIHCGLNDETRDSVTRELLELLPQGGILINTARGKIVQEEPLAEFVAAGKLLAGLDVCQRESDWPSGPLAKLTGSVLTHHSIGGGKGYPPGTAPTPVLPAHAVKNLERYVKGEPLDAVISAEEFDLKT
jgi:phosphoglycerate dehydrogenase-like enzyme